MLTPEINRFGYPLTALSFPGSLTSPASVDILFLEGGKCPTVGQLAHTKYPRWGRAKKTSQPTQYAAQTFCSLYVYLLFNQNIFPFLACMIGSPAGVDQICKDLCHIQPMTSKVRI